MTAETLYDLKPIERETRRKLIRDTALRLFSEKDFRKVSGREIAKACGVSIGTLYNYYKNVDELFLDIFIKNAEDITQQINTKGETPLTLPQLCNIYITFLNENMTYSQMMGYFMLGGSLSKKGCIKLDYKIRSLLDHMEACLIAAGVTIDSRITAHALFSALNGVMISYARYPGRTTKAIKHHTLRLANIIAIKFLSNINN